MSKILAPSSDFCWTGEGLVTIRIPGTDGIIEIEGKIENLLVETDAIGNKKFVIKGTPLSQEGYYRSSKKRIPFNTSRWTQISEETE